MKDRKVILLVIDDARTRVESFKLLLEQEGYTVLAAMGLNDALERLKQREVSVCLLELNLKSENGLQVGRELMRVNEHLKIIILDDRPHYETAVDAMKAKFFDYISWTRPPGFILGAIKKAQEAFEQDWATESHGARQGKKITLVCQHMLVKEGLKGLCNRLQGYYLHKTFPSSDYIKGSDFDPRVELALVCKSCNSHLLRQPENALKPIQVSYPKANILVINGKIDDDEKLRYMGLGVKGFLPPNIDAADMNKAFHSVVNGELWISRRLSKKLLANMLPKYPGNGNYKDIVTPPDKYKLSRRETEILKAIYCGLSNFEISQRLFISENTVKVHVQNVFRKMDVKCRSQVIRKARTACIL